MKRKNESLLFSRHVQELERKEPDKVSYKKLPDWKQKKFEYLCYWQNSDSIEMYRMMLYAVRKNIILREMQK